MVAQRPKNGLMDPFALTSEDGYFWLKGNLHCHTTNSDGRVLPQERLDGYVDQGYGFLCLSDHYEITRVDTVRAPDDSSSSRAPNCIRKIRSAARATTAFTSSP